MDRFQILRAQNENVIPFKLRPDPIDIFTTRKRAVLEDGTVSIYDVCHYAVKAQPNRHEDKYFIGRGVIHDIDGVKSEDTRVLNFYVYKNRVDNCSKGDKHLWGTDGVHSNEYCKKRFMDKPSWMDYKDKELT